MSKTSEKVALIVLLALAAVILGVVYADYKWIWGRSAMHEKSVDRTSELSKGTSETTLKEGRVSISGYGIAEGLVKNDHIAYLGLPFAKPPVGPLRWRSPQPLDTHPDDRLPIIDARSYKPSCIQLKSRKESELGKRLVGVGAQSEDCLYLNVITPKRARESPRPLPVLFFIRGGGFTTGGSTAPLFKPIDLLTKGLDNSVIFVSFDYRLGIFGYAASQTLFDESTDPVGNYGLLDQKAALDWVRENVAAFNGDPKNITVMGHSAGSMSASYLQLLCPEIADKWILLSGTAISWHQRRVEGEFENRLWDELAKECECEKDDMKCMRDVDPFTLNAVGLRFKLDHVFGPTIDKRLIHKPPLEMLESNKHRIGPTVVTAVKDEASIFVKFVNTDDDYQTILGQCYPPELIKLIQRHYPTAKYGSAFMAATAAISDGLFLCPAISYYRTLPRAFFTQFNHFMLAPSLAARIAEKRDYGVFHGSDMMVLFNFNPVTTIPCVSQMMGMRSGILKFILTGNPLPEKSFFARASVWEAGRAVVEKSECKLVWDLYKGEPALPSDFESVFFEQRQGK